MFKVLYTVNVYMCVFTIYLYDTLMDPWNVCIYVCTNVHIPYTYNIQTYVYWSVSTHCTLSLSEPHMHTIACNYFFSQHSSCVTHVSQAMTQNHMMFLQVDIPTQLPHFAPVTKTDTMKSTVFYYNMYGRHGCKSQVHIFWSCLDVIQILFPNILF